MSGTARLPLSRKLFCKCIAAQHINPKLQCNYATALCGLGKANEAISILTSARNDHPNDNKILLTLTDAYVFAGQRKSAIELLKSEAEARCTNAQLWYHLTLLYKESSDIEGAVHVASKAIEETANPRKALLLLSELYVTCYGHNPDGLGDVRFHLLTDIELRKKLCELLASRNQSAELALFIRGLSYKDFESNYQVQTVCALIETGSPYLLNVWLEDGEADFAEKGYTIGQKLLDKNHNRQALVLFRKYLALRPYDSFVAQSICECLLRLGKPDEMLDFARTFMSLNGSNQYIQFMVAKALVRIKKVTQAKELLLECIEEGAESPRLLSYLGYLYILEGDLESQSFILS